MKDDKPTFNKFDDVEHTPLRAFNRYVLMTNLSQDFGPSTVEQYLKLFNQGELEQLRQIHKSILANGVDETRKIVTKDLIIEDERPVEIQEAMQRLADR